ncbi:MAG: hypothetical protein WCY89_10245 [Flavobacteriaceae bacterium]
MSKNRNTIVWTFVFVLLFSSMRAGFMLGFYVIDSESFIELFCVNKEKPELHCDGKCELSKLAHQDDANSERPSYLDIFHRELVYTPHLNLEIYFFASKTLHRYAYQNSYLFLFSTSHDHPPVLV